MAELNSELNPSILGTIEYWDEQYTKEISNFEEYGDVGEIWFGTQCQQRMINWILKCLTIKSDSDILDIGCGNGALLIELADRGYTSLTGIDYSQQGIELAQRVAGDHHHITFKCCNILEVTTISEFNGTIDVCLDKGTYDAISLSQQSERNRNTYICSVNSLLKDDGILLIVSCNWTADELKEHFCSKGFVVMDTIPTPSFQFGGKLGQTTSSIVFRKVLLNKK